MVDYFSQVWVAGKVLLIVNGNVFVSGKVIAMNEDNFIKEKAFVRGGVVLEVFVYGILDYLEQSKLLKKGDGRFCNI